MTDVVLLLSEVFCAANGGPSHGGIQRFCRNLLRACRQLPESEYSIHTLVLCDSPSVPPPEDGIPLPPDTYESFGWNRGKMLAAFIRRLQACRSSDPIILVGGANLISLAIAARILRPKARLAVMLYGYEVFRPLSAWKRFMLRRCDRFCAISQYTRSRFCEVQGMPVDLVDVIHLCIEPEWMALTGMVSDRPRPAGGPRFLCVTRMRSHDAGKNVDVLLRAHARLLETCADARLRIVGDGDLRADYERLARTLNIAHAVQFAGNLSDAQLRDAYAASDIFVLPSVKEGFGLVFLEAMTFGLPCIGANATSVPEIIEHQRSGLLAEPGDIASLATQMLRLAQLSELRVRLGEAGRRRLTERFSFELFSRSVAAFLERIQG